MSKFTPGPWIHVGYGCVIGGDPIQYVKGVRQRQVAVATLSGNIEEDERDANANLMAAAWEMYGALKQVLEICEDGDTGADFNRVVAAMRRAGEALAKADGKGAA